MMRRREKRNWAVGRVIAAIVLLAVATAATSIRGQERATATEPPARQARPSNEAAPPPLTTISLIADHDPGSAQNITGAPDHNPGYPTYDEIVGTLMATANQYPAICQFVDLTELYGLPPTFEGRHMVAVKISDNVGLEEDEPSFMMVAAHHGNEIINPVVALDALGRFTAEYGTDPRVTKAVDRYEIWIAPVWNPDGYEHRTRRNSRGRDLNRDYPFGWFIGGCTSGSQPLTEVETLTMVTWTADQRFDKVIDYHSSGRETLHGYRCLDHPFDDYLIQESILLSEAAGYGGKHRGPSADGEHYQWQLGARGVHAILIETGTQQMPPYPDALIEAEIVWPGTLWMIERPIPLLGRVTDALLGKPLEASIRLLNVTFENGETNNSGGPFGRYHLFAPTGAYLIEFAADGYVPQVYEVSLDTESEQTLDVMLDPIGDRLFLDVDPLIAGSMGSMRTTNATPDKNVYFVYSLLGFGATYVPKLGVTLDLEKPRLIGAVIADANGRAELSGVVPLIAGGKTLYMQAAQVSRVSNVVVTIVN